MLGWNFFTKVKVTQKVSRLPKLTHIVRLTLPCTELVIFVIMTCTKISVLKLTIFHWRLHCWPPNLIKILVSIFLKFHEMLLFCPLWQPFWYTFPWFRLPSQCEQTDWHDWKHYLPATSLAGGKCTSWRRLDCCWSSSMLGEPSLGIDLFAFSFLRSDWFRLSVNEW